MLGWQLVPVTRRVECNVCTEGRERIASKHRWGTDVLYQHLHAYIVLFMAVAGRLDFTGLPALLAAGEGIVQPNFTFVVPLWIMLAWFLVLLTSDARGQQKSLGSNKSMFKASVLARRDIQCFAAVDCAVVRLYKAQACNIMGHPQAHVQMKCRCILAEAAQLVILT